MKTASLLLLVSVFTVGSCSSNDTVQSDNFYRKGRTEYSIHNFTLARKYFNESLKHDTSNLNARLMLAKISYFEKQFKISLEHLEHILKANPQHVGALYWKARTLIIDEDKTATKENESKAVKALQKILEIDNHNIRARSLYALLLEKQGKYKEALYEYSFITMQEESIINTRANLSMLYKRLGLHDKSLKEITRAIEIARITNLKDTNLTLIRREIEK